MLATARIDREPTRYAPHVDRMLAPACDRLALRAADDALRTAAGAGAGRDRARADAAGSALDRREAPPAGALMRVNHVGEVCAQALYTAQALATARPGPAAPAASRPRARKPTTWPGRQQRLDELGARP